MKKRNIIVHTHIFKNAGSSFDDTLERIFGDTFVDHREDHLIHKNKDFLNAYMSENQHVRAFSSHSIYDKPEDFDGVKYHRVYFLRHPIDRIKSVYSFEHKQPAEDSLGATMAKKFDFKGYVAWRMTPEAPPTIRNMQTIFLAGTGKGHGHMDKKYKAALQTLEQNYLIALVDRYDESMVVFEEYLRDIYPNIDLSYIRRNVTDKAQDLSPEEKAQKLLGELGEELAQKVTENNQYDIELYKKANQLLDEKIAKIENFKEKLEAFKQRCIKIKENTESITQTPQFEKEFVKKKIFIQANCQGNIIKHFFNTIGRLSEKYEIIPNKPVHLWEEKEQDFIFEQLHKADIFLHQPVNEKNFGVYGSVNLLKYLKNSVQIVSFPNVYFTGYHPQAMYLKDDSGKKISEPVDYHDRNIVEAFKSGIDYENVLNTFNNPEMYTIEIIKQNIKKSLDELKDRELSTQVKISNFIEKNMIGKKLFHIFNHPTNEVLFELIDLILECMNEKKITIEERLQYKNELLGAVRYPIYKSVQNYFKIDEEVILYKNRKLYSLDEMVTLYFETYREKLTQIKKETIDLIPKIIVQYWDTENIPEEIIKLMNSWKEKNPEYAYHLFNKKSAAEFIYTEYGNEIKELFQRIQIPAMQSDVFRIAFCLHKGGIYIDAASSCLQPLNNFIDHSKDLILMRKWHGRIINGFFAVKPNNRYLSAIFEDIVQNMKDKKINDIWKATGPGLFIQHIDADNEKKMERENILVMDQKELKLSFKLVNDLNHKKDSHWSKEQKYNNIYEYSDMNKVMVTNNFDIYLHFGPHKTGTTSFQNFLENNIIELESNNITLLTVRSDMGKEYKAWRQEYTKCIQGYLLSIPEDPKKTIEKLVVILQKLDILIKPNCNKIILSDENLLGPMPGHFFAAEKGRESGFYKASNVIVQAFKIAFGSRIKSVLLSQRDMYGFITSSYRDFVSKLNNNESITNFYESLDDDFVLQYKEFYTYFLNEFGDTLVNIDFSIFVSHLNQTINNFLCFSVNLPNKLEQVSNQSLSWRAIYTALHTIQILESDSERQRFHKYLLNGLVGGECPNEVSKELAYIQKRIKDSENSNSDHK